MIRRHKKRIIRCCVLLAFVLLGIMLFYPKPLWIIVQRELALPVSLRHATIESMYYEEHAPNGDGTDVIKMVLDDSSWERLVDHLDEAVWWNTPVPLEILADIMNVIDSETRMKEETRMKFFEMYDIIQQEDIYWYFRNRYSLKYEEGKNLIQPSPNYTFAVLYPKSKVLFYVRNDS